MFAHYGLSPRVRGNQYDFIRNRFRPGPIPACAGQPSIVVDRKGAVGAYPRVCGATGRLAKNCCFDTGLSPRVRGNLLYLTH